MKRTLLSIVAAMMITVSASAQRLTDITAEARFITDKMVVELGLTNIQRNSILQLNLSYLNGINSYRDINANGWSYRNKQLKKMLTAKQWKRYKEASYFYRPIGWRNNAYVHNIYNKYPKAPKRQVCPPPAPNGPRFDGPRPDGPRFDGKRPGGPRPDGPRPPKMDKKDKKGKKPSFGNGRREFNNNSPEAIRMRQDMRQGMMRGAR